MLDYKEIIKKVINPEGLEAIVLKQQKQCLLHAVKAAKAYVPLSRQLILELHALSAEGETSFRAGQFRNEIRAEVVSVEDFTPAGFKEILQVIRFERRRGFFTKKGSGMWLAPVVAKSRDSKAYSDEIIYVANVVEVQGELTDDEFSTQWLTKFAGQQIEIRYPTCKDGDLSTEEYMNAETEDQIASFNFAIDQANQAEKKKKCIEFITSALRQHGFPDHNHRVFALGLLNFLFIRYDIGIVGIQNRRQFILNDFETLLNLVEEGLTSFSVDARDSFLQELIHELEREVLAHKTEMQPLNADQKNTATQLPYEEVKKQEIPHVKMHSFVLSVDEDNNLYSLEIFFTGNAETVNVRQVIADCAVHVDAWNYKITINPQYSNFCNPSCDFYTFKATISGIIECKPTDRIRTQKICDIDRVLKNISILSESDVCQIVSTWNSAEIKTVLNEQKMKDDTIFKRNAILIKAIDDHFKIVSGDRGDEGYLFVGSGAYVFSFHGIVMDTEYILTTQVKAATADTPLTVCDIGAGDFSFSKYVFSEFPGKIIPYGIGAKPIGSGTSRSKLPATYFVYDNAEYMSRVFSNQKFDWEFSHVTCIHFVDPIGSIMEMYSTLKVGGILVIDRFIVRGCDSHIEDIILFLSSQGYRIVADKSKIESAQINNFIIQKTAEKPELVFPVMLDYVDRYAFYKPNKYLIDFSRLGREQSKLCYKRGVVFVNKQVRLIYGAVFNEMDQCQTLPQLFSFLHKKDVEHKELYYTLLYFFSKKSQDVAELKNRLPKAEEAPLSQLYYRLNAKDYFNGLYTLSFNDDFKTLTVDVRLMLMEYAALQDLIAIGKKSVIKNKFDQYQWPYQEENPDNRYEIRLKDFFPEFLIKEVASNIVVPNERGCWLFFKEMTRLLCSCKSEPPQASVNDASYIRL